MELQALEVAQSLKEVWILGTPDFSITATLVQDERSPDDLCGQLRVLRCCKVLKSYP